MQFNRNVLVYCNIKCHTYKNIIFINAQKVGHSFLFLFFVCVWKGPGSLWTSWIHWGNVFWLVVYTCKVSQILRSHFLALLHTHLKASSCYFLQCHTVRLQHSYFRHGRIHKSEHSSFWIPFIINSHSKYCKNSAPSSQLLRLNISEEMLTGDILRNSQMMPWTVLTVLS